MARRVKLRVQSILQRLKRPLNPSVLGTAKQADRKEKGGRIGHRRPAEGRGHPPGGGRGGKASRHD